MLLPFLLHQLPGAAGTETSRPCGTQRHPQTAEGIDGGAYALNRFNLCHSGILAVHRTNQL